jgi:uracil permease
MSVEKQPQSHIIGVDDHLPTGKLVVLGLQHTFTMFGATILVPLLTGLSITVSLFMAGVCTLLFHLITKGKVPVFLGSSFAFLVPIAFVAYGSHFLMGDRLGLDMGLEYAQGGIVVAGCVYLLLAGLVYLFGYKRIASFFPPVVTGPIIICIGLILAPVAIDNASDNWLVALFTFIVVCVVSIFLKGFIKLLPVLCGLVAGYLFALAFGLVDFTAIGEASWVGIPNFTLAKFDWRAILVIAPVAIATMVEHIGDIIAISETTKRDYMKEPGLHRTLIGDGLASVLSAMFGGPANTTYSENTGVLVLTGVHKPRVMQVAACFAILMALTPKLGAIIQTIPTAVVGGIMIVLFGMIASIGARNLVENKVDFTQSRNLIISAVILVLGIGGAALDFVIGTVDFSLSGLATAAIIGIILNKVLPNKA